MHSCNGPHRNQDTTTGEYKQTHYQHCLYQSISVTYIFVPNMWKRGEIKPFFSPNIWQRFIQFFAFEVCNATWPAVDENVCISIFISPGRGYTYFCIALTCVHKLTIRLLLQKVQISLALAMWTLKCIKTGFTVPSASDFWPITVATTDNIVTYAGTMSALRDIVWKLSIRWETY